MLQRRNRELAQARDGAAIADQAKSRFLASTSHELRTPLNAILGACEVVDGSHLSPVEREALAGARHAGHHLLFLVNSMIDLSKLESGAAPSVLIVDDSPDNRLLLRVFLNGAVTALDEAEDGAQGVEMFRARRYDVVLMDMHMPVMGGIEATRAMRALEAQRGDAPATILALTADDSLDDRRRSTEAGCDEHLVKPISKKALLAAIAAHQPDAGHAA